MRSMAKWRCPSCGFKFDAKEPPASIPVSVVRCPKCGDIAEQEKMRSEAEIRERLRYYQGCPIDEIETWKETREYMLGYVMGLLEWVLGEE